MELQTKKNSVILLLHGFKRGNVNDFEYLEGPLSKLNIPIINFEYYDNYDKKTLSWKKFFEKIENEMKQLIDKEVIIIGYSIGAIIAVYLENKYPNVKRVISVYPAFKIYLFDWIRRIRSLYFKRKRLKKRIGKERFNKLNELAKKSKVVEKYPVRITIHINIFRAKLVRKIKWVNSKNTIFILSEIDEVVYYKKTEKYLKKINANPKIIYFNLSHYTAFKDGKNLCDFIVNEVKSYID